MLKKVIPLTLIVLIILAGIAYVFLSPTNPKQDSSSSAQKTNSSESNTSKARSIAVPSIQSYASLQFKIPEDEIKIVSSEKQEWDDICLGIKIPDYDCTKKAISGYEVTVEINGNKTTYRASNDGSIIRIVKNK